MPLYPPPLRLPEPTQRDTGFTAADYAAMEVRDRQQNVEDPSDLEGLRALLARNDLTPAQRESAERGYAMATGGAPPPSVGDDEVGPIAGRARRQGRSVSIATVDDARKALPELAGLSDDAVVGVLQQVYYPTTSREAVANALGVRPPVEPPPPREGLGTAFGRGLKESFQQLPQLGFGLGAGVAAGAETAFGEGGIATSLKDFATRKYKEWEDKIAAQARPEDSLETSWTAAKQGDIGALANWLSHGVGYVGGQAAQVLASGGVGMVGGRFVSQTAGKQLAEAMVNREIAGMMAQGPVRMGADELLAVATARVADKFAAAGMNAAVAGMGFGQEGGEIFGGLTADNAGRTLSGAELARATWSTLLAGSLEFVGDKFGLNLALGKSGVTSAAAGIPGMGGRLARAGLGAGAAIPVEAGTEYLQTGIEAFGAGREQDMLPFNQSPDSQRQAFEAAALGALGGGLVGGGAGLLSRAKERAAAPGSSAATLAATADALDGERVQAAAAATRLATAPDVASMGQAASDLAFSSQLLPPGLTKATGAEAATTIEQVRAGVAGEAEVIESPFGDRVLTVREQLADPAVRDAIRAQFGIEALDNAMYYIEAADSRKNIPDVTRERMLSVAETIISRATLQPIAGTSALAGIGPAPAQIGMAPRPLQVGMDTTPTGRLITTPEGTTRPETRSDVLSRAPETSQALAAERTAAEQRQAVAQQGGPGMVLPTPRGEAVIDQNAHTAAVSDTNDKKVTPAQQLGGNAELGHDNVTFPGLNLSIENPAGTVRQDLKNTPPKWKTMMRHHYGYIRGTKGKDKDHVDVFVQPGTPQGYTGTVYVVDQTNSDGSFDEHKVLLGFDSEQAAREAYLSNYEKGWESRIRGITPMPFDQFKAWVFDQEATTKPLRDRLPQEVIDAFAGKGLRPLVDEQDSQPDADPVAKRWREMSREERARVIEKAGVPAGVIQVEALDALKPEIEQKLRAAIQGESNAADAVREPEGAGAQHREGEGGGQAPEAGGGDRTGGAAPQSQAQEDDQLPAGRVEVSPETRQRIDLMKRLSVLKSLKECLNA